MPQLGPCVHCGTIAKVDLDGACSWCWYVKTHPTWRTRLEAEIAALDARAGAER